MMHPLIGGEQHKQQGRLKPRAHLDIEIGGLGSQFKNLIADAENAPPWRHRAAGAGDHLAM